MKKSVEIGYKKVEMIKKKPGTLFFSQQANRA